MWEMKQVYVWSFGATPVQFVIRQPSRRGGNRVQTFNKRYKVGIDIDNSSMVDVQREFQSHFWYTVPSNGLEKESASTANNFGPKFVSVLSFISCTAS